MSACTAFSDVFTTIRESDFPVGFPIRAGQDRSFLDLLSRVAAPHFAKYTGLYGNHITARPQAPELFFEGKQIREELGMKWLKSALGLNRELNRQLLDAARMGHVESVRRLLAEGADTETRKAKKEVPRSEDRTLGWRPLHWAADNGHASVVEMLIQAGANKEAKDKHGRTPLHVAAWRHPSVVKVLIQAGARTKAKDKNGLTPLHYAEGQGKNGAPIVAILRKAAVQGVGRKGESG